MTVLDILDCWKLRADLGTVDTTASEVGITVVASMRMKIQSAHALGVLIPGFGQEVDLERTPTELLLAQKVSEL